jgi:hypothetical protein
MLLNSLGLAKKFQPEDAKRGDAAQTAAVGTVILQPADLHNRRPTTLAYEVQYEVEERT